MHRSVLRFVLGLSLGLLVVACSGGGGGGGESFLLPDITVKEGAEWQINREIVFTFTDEVKFSSVNLNTINIQTTAGAPATGSFSLRKDVEGKERLVVFQP